jgi:hypothetical protein
VPLALLSLIATKGPFSENSEPGKTLM